jgi:replication-associated recombination protein RarA
MNGIGKTCFVVETAYFMHSRYEFHDGVFLVELNSSKTVDQIKTKMKDLKIIKEELTTEFQNKKMLLIFDNVDNILKSNKAQFDWFLKDLLGSSPHLKVILTTKKHIRNSDF